MQSVQEHLLNTFEAHWTYLSLPFMHENLQTTDGDLPCRQLIIVTFFVSDYTNFGWIWANTAMPGESLHIHE